RKGNRIYAIFPKWPGKLLKIRNFNLQTDGRKVHVETVTLLKTGENLNFRIKGSDLLISMPEERTEEPGGVRIEVRGEG
ncbi:MAG: hypothetical protein R6V75_10155, partial [Bacteroidales bacterium]